VARFAFNVLIKGDSALVLRGEPDFPLSFADVCGMPAYSQSNGGIDEVVPATVSTECPEVVNVVFRNGVETGDTSVWTGFAG
jgi:hypothetical protein